MAVFVLLQLHIMQQVWLSGMMEVHSSSAAGEDSTTTSPVPAHYATLTQALKDCMRVQSSSVCRIASGTNLGPIRDQPPSGQPVRFSGMTLLRFNAAGQIQQSVVFR
jgi:hypothetical protein